MKKYILPLIIICLVHTLAAQTNVSGYILSNTTWTLGGSPYVVTGNILVNNGVTLTIEPGVTVKFDTTKSLQIDGELLAIGNAQNRISFTATDTTPARGSWGRIQFSPNSMDAVFDTAGNYVSGSIFKYCDIRYGGGVPGDVTVYCDTAAPYFSNCRIADCLKNAIYFLNAVGRVDSSAIRNCGGAAMLYANPDSSDLIVNNDTIENNGGGVVYNGSGAFADITILHCKFVSTGNAVSLSMTFYFSANNSNYSFSIPTISVNVIIENNEFISNSTAINIAASEGSVISNNVFTSNQHAIRGALGINATVTDNVFIGNTQSVIGAPVCVSSIFDVPASNLSASNLTITGNYFENNKGGIFAIGPDYGNTSSLPYSIVHGNTFLNNQFIYVDDCSSYSSTGAYYFFRFFSGRGQITNNVIDGNTSAGSGSGSLLKCFSQWEIAHNFIKNNTRGLLACSGEANICQNKFLNNAGPIISSSGTSAGPFIHDNEFINNSGSGSAISLSNNSVINNNDFQGNSSSVISISGGTSAIFNNRILNNSMTGSNPIISISNTNSSIHNNDFLNNTGLSGVRISGTTQPVVTQNNFINPGIQYEIENQIAFGPGANINLSNNYWGTTNTAHIDSVIKDYFDDANLSVALYPPVLSSPAFVDTNASCTSVVCSLSVSGTAVNPSCYGGSNGSVNISVSNGTTPYTYVWSSGASTEDISGRTSGSFTVTVIDANFCSVTKSFTLTQPSSPVAVVNGVVTNANCNTGGAITSLPVEVQVPTPTTGAAASPPKTAPG